MFRGFPTESLATLSKSHLDRRASFAIMYFPQNSRGCVSASKNVPMPRSWINDNKAQGWISMYFSLHVLHFLGCFCKCEQCRSSYTRKNDRQPSNNIINLIRTAMKAQFLTAHSAPVHWEQLLEQHDWPFWLDHCWWFSFANRLWKFEPFL